MNKLLWLLLLLSLSGAVAAADNFAERDDVRAFIVQMHEKHGFSSEELRRLFRKVQALPAVIKAVTPPTEAAARSWRAYRDRFVEAKHISGGLEFWQANADTLASASARYGVPEEILVAIIGIETMYGRRAGLFRRELENLLLLARDAHRDPLSYRGSFAGAIGMPQFLPSTVRGYAVDFDGSGAIDLTGSPGDAIGSVANFLKERGWEPGGTIALPATVNGDRATVLLADGVAPKRKPSEMTEFGVSAEAAPEQPAALIDLVTPNEPTEYRLGFGNFYVLTRYNRSSAYATAVFDLAQALAAARQTPTAPYNKASRPTPSR
jgi:membrane-bound lytic murein transglycosylase B